MNERQILILNLKAGYQQREILPYKLCSMDESDELGTINITQEKIDWEGLADAIFKRDSVVREKAYKRAAKILTDEVARHKEMLRMAGSSDHQFCEDYGCTSLEEFAMQILFLKEQ
jgi:hypothetical protein